MISVLEIARRVLSIESAAIDALSARLGEPFECAVALLTQCQGRVVVTGLGKSGAIGRKLASTLASTGTPALFVHATEALHGDLGMVARGDVLLAISYSGRSDELLGMLPVVRGMDVPVIALTGNLESYLARQSDVALDTSVEKEACPLNLAPTSSTTAALALGDALAICLMETRGFAIPDFARFHPGGALGRGAALTVGDLMRTHNRIALCPERASVREALQEITPRRFGRRARHRRGGRARRLLDRRRRAAPLVAKRRRDAAFAFASDKMDDAFAAFVAPADARIGSVAIAAKSHFQRRAGCGRSE